MATHANCNTLDFFHYTYLKSIELGFKKYSAEYKNYDEFFSIFWSNWHRVPQLFDRTKTFYTAFTERIT
jgi:hypothetical protein